MKCISGCALWVALALASPASGQTCTVTAAPAFFGNYDTYTPVPLDVDTRIGVTCAPGVTYAIKLDSGQNAGANFSHRRMRASAGRTMLRYNLYLDSACTIIWGDGTGGSSFATRIGTGALDDVEVFGRIPPNQNVKVDFYTDSVVVTVEW